MYFQCGEVVFDVRTREVERHKERVAESRLRLPVSQSYNLYKDSLQWTQGSPVHRGGGGEGDIPLLHRLRLMLPLEGLILSPLDHPGVREARSRHV